MGTVQSRKVNMSHTFVNKQALSQAIGLSPHTFKKYRLSNKWVEGIHWQRLNSKCVLYNLTLIEDWVANRLQPEAHDRAIEGYLRSLPSNQPKTPRSKHTAA
ncbi:excisionase family protein [Altericista sp. CCNU0014]|uniref:excisionase family protein n=1 Tax=Altericista sp. CCNU0014 TaxID=3082949 RepID=UPI00384C558B